MKKLFTKVKDFFSRGFSKLFGSPEGASRIDFLQKSMLILILKWRAEAIKLIDAQKLLIRAQTRLDDFLRINSSLPVEDLSVENINARRRIKNRIRATAFADAILGFMAITVMLKVLLNVTIAWIPAMLIGGVIAYWLLIYAIEDRIDATGGEATNTQAIIGRFAFIIPLLFLPAANLFVVFTNPGNPANILLTAFLVLALLLNLSTARHYRQYKLMKDTEKSLSLMKKLTKERNDCEKTVIAQKEVSDRIGDQITVNAFDLKREYQVMNPKPALALSIDKQIFLNDQIYHEDVFPISQIRLTKPTGDMAELSNIWIAATTIEMPPTRQSTPGQMQPEIEQPVQETEINEGQDNHNNTRQNNREQETQYVDMDNQHGNRTTINEEAAGEFGEVFNENEIIV
jgi:hypothetical protein